MIPLPVTELAGLGALETDRDEITGVQVDSRRVVPGDLFVAVGAGVAFVADARARGAVATLVPDDPHAALARIGGLVRDRSGAQFVAITGSMGKTTTKDILAALCRPHARTVAAESSYNNEIGVPLTLCRLELDTEVCVLELAMRGFRQIAQLCAFSRPGIGVITSIGPVHLEKVGTIDGVRRAKTELLEALPPGGTAIVPASLLVARDDLTVVRVGEDVRLEGFELRGEGAVVSTSLGAIEVNFTMRHLAENVAYALAAYRALGLPLDRAGEGASAIEFADWRNQELPLPGGGLLINDAWNANPVSMRAALEHLRERAAGRRTIAVLGEMAELGDYSEEGHREVARAIEEVGIDVVVSVGPQAQAYGGSWVAGADQAAGLLRDLLAPGDCVLVKGARALALEGIAHDLANVAF
ncbi:MAG TPA: UDP-N-acetylmuramoyl-tripeptide--D-alanyl-D-alanine ligase [Gaiellaceae bacterium]|nr:UDP-N-acetylmuramoyl-tripeptide--D-alanyl-D-alanine ligase [Gaiellaceae bacterium]